MNTHPSPSALVVEGGAMRGIFASGVLDAFIEHDYRPFDFAIGVSAGATNLLAYLASQHGRSHDILTELAETVHARIDGRRHVHLVLENDRNESRYLGRDATGQPRQASAHRASASG